MAIVRVMVDWEIGTWYYYYYYYIIIIADCCMDDQQFNYCMILPSLCMGRSGCLFQIIKDTLCIKVRKSCHWPLFLAVSLECYYISSLFVLPFMSSTTQHTLLVCD